MTSNASSPLATVSHVSVEPPGGLTAQPDQVHEQPRDAALLRSGLVMQRYFTHAGLSPYDEVAVGEAPGIDYG